MLNTPIRTKSECDGHERGVGPLSNSLTCGLDNTFRRINQQLLFGILFVSGVERELEQRRFQRSFNITFAVQGIN